MRKNVNRKTLKKVFPILAIAAAMAAMSGCGTKEEKPAAPSVQAGETKVEGTEETKAVTENNAGEEPAGSDETFYLTASNSPEWTARMRHCWVDNGYLYQQ